MRQKAKNKQNKTHRGNMVRSRSLLLMNDSDTDDEYYWRYITVPTVLRQRAQKKAKKRQGSLAGRRPNVERSREVYAARLQQDYFGANPTYNDVDFRRRFRMRRELFERLTNDLVEDHECNYFTQRPDATGKLGFTPEQKVTVAMRMLAYGASADQLDEVMRMGESTVLETLKTFCKSIIRIHGAEYLRAPTVDDLNMLLAENAERGFPGMIGSIDCMHWTWKNCPTAWHGVFQGKEKEPTVILEAVASKSLWIWHAFFGTPGSNNDINVLHRSPLLDDLVNGVAPSVQYVVNGSTYDQAYYLADGIYPEWAIFQQSIAAPQGLKRKRYASKQEEVRKDVERAFGVLQQRFRIIALPCKLWSPAAMQDVMLACVILHNMIIEDEGGVGELNNEYLYNDGYASPATSTQADSSPVADMARNLEAIEDGNSHFELKTDLIEHVWNLYGETG